MITLDDIHTYRKVTCLHALDQPLVDELVKIILELDARKSKLPEDFTDEQADEIGRRLQVFFSLKRDFKAGEGYYKTKDKPKKVGGISRTCLRFMREVLAGQEKGEKWTQ